MSLMTMPLEERYVNPDTQFTSRIASPQAEINWKILQELYPNICNVSFDEIKRRWEATGKTLTWHNVQCLRLQEATAYVAHDDREHEENVNIWSLSECAVSIVADFFFIGLGCWNLRSTFRTSNAKELLADITTLAAPRQVEFEYMMSELENAQSTKEKAQAVFTLVKFFTGALSFEAIYKALFSHLSVWEAFLYAVCGITEIVAAFSRAGEALIAQILNIICSADFLVSDIVKLLNTWKMYKNSQISGVTLEIEYKIMLHSQEKKRYLNGVKCMQYCLLTNCDEGSRWIFESSNTGSDSVYKIKCSDANAGKKFYLHRVQEERHNDPAQRDTDLVEDKNLCGTDWEVKREGYGAVVIANTSNMGILSGRSTSKENCNGGVWVMINKPDMDNRWCLVKP